jgi:hypothetical protein
MSYLVQAALKKKSPVFNEISDTVILVPIDVENVI